MTRTAKHKNSKTVRYSVIAGIAVLLVLMSVYFFRSTYYTNHFLPNTKINETDVSNLSVEQANEKLQETYSKQTLAIKENGQVWKEIEKSDLGYKDDFTEELKPLLEKQNGWSWVTKYVSADEDKTIDPLSGDQEKLTTTTEQIKTELTDLNKDRKETTNATINKQNNQFVITPEVNGDTIDVDAAVKEVKNAVVSGENTIDLSKFKQKPTITSDDATLKKNLAEINTIADVKATYSINGETFQVPSDKIADWLTYTDGKIDLDTAKVREYVASLGEKYNTSTNDTKFKSTKRGEVTVPAGTYSWTIQTDSETEALKQAILAGKDFTRSPLVQGSTTADHALVEDTYIEVDLENQHMWFYKDGKVVLETDIVSGKPATPTPPGVFYVWNKEKNATLRGLNDDGTPYESPVDYWLPIDWTGIGIHDSDWQPEYGGDLWKTRGSHGCVNTPPSVMKELFEKVDKGTPVLVF